MENETFSSRSQEIKSLRREFEGSVKFIESLNSLITNLVKTVRGLRESNDIGEAEKKERTQGAIQSLVEALNRVESIKTEAIYLRQNIDELLELENMGWEILENMKVDLKKAN